MGRAEFAFFFPLRGAFPLPREEVEIRFTFPTPGDVVESDGKVEPAPFIKSSSHDCMSSLSSNARETRDAPFFSESVALIDSVPTTSSSWSNVSISFTAFLVLALGVFAKSDWKKSLNGFFFTAAGSALDADCVVEFSLCVVAEELTPNIKRLVLESGLPVPRHVATSMTVP
ncbi:MAG: hypothetical protein ACO3QV_03880, partial [Candidatus Nanopelagicaceae bacterium]